MNLGAPLLFRVCLMILVSVFVVEGVSVQFSNNVCACMVMDI